MGWRDKYCMWGQKKLRNIVVECRNILVAYSSYGIGFVKRTSSTKTVLEKTVFEHCFSTMFLESTVLDLPDMKPIGSCPHSLLDYVHNLQPSLSYLLHRLAPSSNIFGQRSVTAVQSTLFSRWGDLVFFQNGIMESWLESKGLEDANQLTWLWAKIIATLETIIARLCMFKSQVLDKEVFQKQMLEKLIWICSVMLVGAPHGGVSVGVMDKEFRSELSSLITELESAASSEKGLTFEEAMEECLCAYSRAIAHFPTVVKEFKWRNGWFYSLSDGMWGFTFIGYIFLQLISKHGIFLSYCAIWEISEISDHGIFLTPLFEPFVIPLLLEKLSSSLHSAKSFCITKLQISPSFIACYVNNCISTGLDLQGILSTERGQSALESFDSYQRSVIEFKIYK
ncbi:hypothetical protein HKD37_17G048719 [Glycine soja]